MWWSIREKWVGSPTARRNGIAALALLIVLALPWHTDISGDGFLQADPYTRIYPPAPARLLKVLVSEGQSVRKGDVLFILESPSTDWRLKAAQEQIVGLKSQLAGTVGSESLLERKSALEQQLAEAKAELSSQKDDNYRLQIVAPHDGIFHDLDDGLYPGAWLRMNRMLGLVAGNENTSAQIFINETDVARIKIGDYAEIWTRTPDTNSFDAQVTNIDKTAATILPEAMLASPYGGPIAAHADARGAMIPHESLYRITLKIKGAAKARQLTQVSALIDADRSSFLLDVGRKVAGILIKESGF